MQLAANAVQHSSDGSVIRLGSRLSGGTLTVWVDDEGVGVDPDDAERIFARFQRGSHGRRSSGLGLSIVGAICEAHGGRALLVPKQGQGARFEIRIPATVIARAPAPAVVSPA
jgi:signal transduction histidine kinase